MLCQSCSKNQATTHIKTMINGELREYLLCPECAKKLGYGSLLNGFGPNLGSFLGSFLGENASGNPAGEVERCKGCGSSFAEIAKTGEVGCAECYQTFYERMIPSIQRIHGNTTHNGKLAASAGAGARLKGELEQFRAQLKEAIEKQEFEKAAELRDRIRDLEGQVERHE